MRHAKRDAMPVKVVADVALTDGAGRRDAWHGDADATPPDERQ